MARYSEDPVSQIISFRVNEEEKKLIQLLAKGHSVSISILLRRCLCLLKDFPEQVHAELRRANQIEMIQQGNEHDK